MFKTRVRKGDTVVIGNSRVHVSSTGEAALGLCIEAGDEPILIERGADALAEQRAERVLAPARETNVTLAGAGPWALAPPVFPCGTTYGIQPIA